MRWPGLPQSAWPSLDRLHRMVQEALNVRSDGSVVVRKGKGGSFLSYPFKGFLAVITGGSNPYSWRMLEWDSAGSVDVLFASEASVDGQSGPDSSDDTFASGMGSARFRPAYEKFGNKDVLPGTVVWIETAWLDTVGSTSQDQEYTFIHRDGPVAAKVSTSSAPNTTLGASLTDSATSMQVASWSGFPYRANFRVKIDDEVIEVTEDTSSTTRNISRGKDGTVAVAHSNGATVTLCDAYSWVEQRQVASGNDLWEDRPEGHTGDFTTEPARERNQACAVPDGTYVLLRRKARDGAGSSTITADLSKTDTTVTVSSGASFPQSGKFYIRVDGEFMKVTAGAGSSSFTVERGKYLSPATRHESGNAVVEAICEWVFDWCCGQSILQNIIINIGGGSGGKLYTFGGGGASSQTVGASATDDVTFASSSWAKPTGTTYFTSTSTIKFPIAGWWQINYSVEGDFTFGDTSSELPFTVESDGYINDVAITGLHDCKECASLIFTEGTGDLTSSGVSETADFDTFCLQKSRQVLVAKGDILKIKCTNNSATDAATLNETWIDGFFVGAG